MKGIILLYFCLLFEVLGAKTIEKCISIIFLEERINGILFSYRSDVIDGQKKETWTIHGKAVSRHEYEEAILEAEKEERRIHRQREYEKLKRKERLKDNLQKSTLSKLLYLSIKKVADELDKLSDERLQPYLSFNRATIESAEELVVIKDNVHKAKKLAQTISSDVEWDMQEINTMIQILESYPDRLEKLYYQTVEYAMQACDDTKMLKDFLKLIS